MGLKINIESIQMPQVLLTSLALENASEMYMRIDSYSGEGTTCRFSLSFYNVRTNEDRTCEFSKINFPDRTYSFEVNESEDENDFNVRKQAYEYLKTLPEFQGCEDC